MTAFYFRRNTIRSQLDCEPVTGVTSGPGPRIGFSAVPCTSKVKWLRRFTKPGIPGHDKAKVWLDDEQRCYCLS